MSLIEEYRRYVPRRVTWLVQGRRAALKSHLEASIRVTGLPIRRPRHGEVWGISIVRNEADVIGSTVTHLLDQGLDRLIVVDHGSTDATPDILADLASVLPVHVGTDAEPAWYQGRKMSYLAHLAWRAGADWIVPFDADEHWYAEDMSVADHLRSAPEPVVRAAIHEALPASGLRALDVKADDAVRIDARPTGVVKVAFRAVSGLDVVEGNHEVHLPGERGEGLHLLHFQWRNADQLVRKVREGSAALRATDLEGVGTHWLRLSDALGDSADAEIEAQWRLILAEGTENRQAARFVTLANPWKRWRTWDPDGALSHAWGHSDTAS